MNKSSTCYIDGSKQYTDNQSQNKLIPIQGKHRNVSPNVLYRQADSYDDLKINLLQSKNNCNKKTQEIRQLKLVLHRLNQDHNSNVQLIGNMLKIANKSQVKQPIDICEQIKQGDFTQQNMHFLKETHQSLILKRKNQEVKTQIKDSAKELEDLKQKTRAARLIELENAMHVRDNKIRLLTQNNEALQEQANELQFKLKESIENVDYHKNALIQIQIEYQETVSKLHEHNQKNDTLKKTKGSYEEKLSNQKFIIKNLNKSLRQKDDYLKRYEASQTVINKFKEDKPSLEKTEEERLNKIKELTNEFNGLNEKANQLENQHISNKEKLNEFDKERSKFLPYLKEQNSTYKDKDRKIKQLEELIIKETGIKDEAENEIKLKTEILDSEVQALISDMNNLNQKVIELNQITSNIDDELNDLNKQKHNYDTKAINDQKQIKELNMKIKHLIELKDCSLDNLMEEEALISNERKNQDKDKDKNMENDEEKDEENEIKKQIKELEIKIKKTEEILEKNIEMNKENEDIIKNLNNQIEIDQLIKEIEGLQKDIKDLQNL